MFTLTESISETGFRYTNRQTNKHTQKETETTLTFSNLMKNALLL